MFQIVFDYADHKEAPPTPTPGVRCDPLIV
jgi:hypothetical protein